MLDQFDTPFETFMDDGAFDGEPISQAVLNRHPDAMVIVPPHKTAVVSSAGDTQRDEHIREIATHGRIAWQKKNGYGLRTHVELAIQRYKRIIGSVKKAPCVAATKDRGVGQCIRTEHDDQSWNAGFGEYLKRVEK